jgi:hypothetical protein
MSLIVGDKFVKRGSGADGVPFRPFEAVGPVPHDFRLAGQFA